MHKTSEMERKAEADVEETQREELSRKGWEAAEGWAEERAPEFRMCLSSFTSPITPVNPDLPCGPSTSPDGGWKM